MRWTPIEGATGYQVWYPNVPREQTIAFKTKTNVADEREY